MTPKSLSISIVSFDPDFALLERTLKSLAGSIRRAAADGKLARSEVSILDNGPGDGCLSRLVELTTSTFGDIPDLRAEAKATGANLGYGRANNIAIRASDADYHLVLNPDVELAEDAISEALRYMDKHGEVLLLSPYSVDASGKRQFLIKRYPRAWIFLLRGFMPKPLHAPFEQDLAEYEFRDAPGYREVTGRFIASGCFMFARREALAAVGGFDESYFLYFEDFDLSLRIGARGLLAFVPSVKIVHYGGYAASKGWRHRFLFMRSAIRFFRTYGWRWV
jgi:GT2 family glycosyltransferase